MRKNINKTALVDIIMFAPQINIVKIITYQIKKIVKIYVLQKLVKIAFPFVLPEKTVVLVVNKK